MLHTMNVIEILPGFKCLLNSVCIFHFDKDFKNIHVQLLVISIPLDNLF